VLAAECDKQHRHEAVLAAQADEQRRHEAVLAAEADKQRWHEAAARAAESKALALVEVCRCHTGATRASLSAVSPVAEVQCRHEADDHVHASAELLLAVCPRARPRRRTGRRNIPRAPNSSAAVAPTHPDILQGGLPTPTSTTLAGATSPCCSVVSSTPPGWTMPDTPSLQPFGNERDASTAHIVLAGDINLALPINLLDGLRWGGGVYCFLVHPFGRSVPFFFSSISQ
jgi:hypothetical protein